MANGDRDALTKVVSLLRSAALGLGDWCKEVSEARVREEGLGPALLLGYTAHGVLMGAVTLAEQARDALTS